MKKFLTALLIGAFVFGVGSADISTAKAASDKNQSTHDKFDKNRDGDNQRPLEPPKDENGNPMSPPNHDGNSDRNGDNQRPPEPPKDENGNPMPPPNHDGNSDRNGDNQNRPAPPNHDGNSSSVRK